MGEHYTKFINRKIVLAICAWFFGVVSIVIWALPVLKFSKGFEVGSYLSDITGFQLAFGGYVYRSSISPYAPIKMSLNSCPLATTGFIFIVLGFVISVISYIMTLKNVNNKIWKILIFASAIFYLIGGIISFFLQYSFQLSIQSEELEYFKMRMLADYNVCPFIGIIGIVCSLLNGLQIIFLNKY